MGSEVATKVWSEVYAVKEIAWGDDEYTRSTEADFSVYLW